MRHVNSLNPCPFAKGGLTSSNFAIRVGVKYFFYKGVALKGDCLERGRGSLL